MNDPLYIYNIGLIVNLVVIWLYLLYKIFIDTILMDGKDKAFLIIGISILILLSWVGFFVLLILSFISIISYAFKEKRI